MALRSRKRESAAPEPIGPVRLLVVHDDTEGCELLVRVLSGAGYPVDRAHDHEQMSDALANSPTCVVLDVSSSGFGGNLKLLDTVRHHAVPRVANCRVVLIGTGTSSAMFSWQAGIDGFLRRPFHADDLIATVAEAITRPDDDRKPHRRRMVEAARIGERA